MSEQTKSRHIKAKLPRQQNLSSMFRAATKTAFLTCKSSKCQGLFVLLHLYVIISGSKIETAAMYETKKAEDLKQFRVKTTVRCVVSFKTCRFPSIDKICLFFFFRVALFEINLILHHNKTKITTGTRLNEF